MSDLIMPLVDEKDPFLREVPHRFDFDSPHEDPDKFEERLIENMIHYKGIGLSANQIGIPVTAFAMIMDSENALAVFNPEILEWSDETTYIREGCLSFPGLYVAVERAHSIAAKFQLFDGEEQGASFSDLSARIFQHESEHMDGDIFIDNVNSFRLKSAMKKRKQFLKKMYRR